jgi:hypothetical protein
MKRVLIVDASSRGLPYDYYYIKELSKHYNVDFFYSKTKFNYEYIELLKNEENINLYEYHISGYPRLISTINYLKLLIYIIKNKNKYRKIHFFWSILFFLELPIFVLLKNKLIFTFHNDKPHERKKNGYLPYKIIYHLAKLNIFVSSFTKDRFIKNNNIKHKKFKIVNHGVLPISVNDNIIINSKIEKTIIFWGLVKDYKGVDIFLNLLNNKFLQDYQFEIIGKWDNSMSNLQKQLLTYNNIKIINKFISLEELKLLLQRDAIFILPYKNATQSGVLYTFLAYTKIFIASDVGENSTFLKENDLENLIFKREDVSSIINAIKYSEKNNQIIKEKLLLIKEKYKWEYILNEKTIKEIYE